jgi:hypothetical protein
VGQRQEAKVVEEANRSADRDRCTDTQPWPGTGVCNVCLVYNFNLHVTLLVTIVYSDFEIVK